MDATKGAENLNNFTETFRIHVQFLSTQSTLLARSEAKTTIKELAEFLSERFLVAFVLVVRCELCLAFTYRSARMFVGYGDEEFSSFSAESEARRMDPIIQIFE
jgi:hypothetical protein